MKITVNHHHYTHADEDVVHVLNELRLTLQSVRREIMAILDPLAAEVAETKTIMESAVLLIEGIAAQLEEHKNEPAEIQRLADELNTTSEALARAVAENTPEAP